MNTIVPAIIPQSLDHLKESLRSIEGAVQEVQVDIVDGSFVPFTSWPYRGNGSVMLLREHAHLFDIEVDLMIQRPEVALPLYVEAGAKRVVIHLESTHEETMIYEHHGSHQYLLGLSISNETPLKRLMDAIPHADYVQLMGIHTIGSQGQPFDREVLERIRTIRAEHPNLVISIDGSVNEETLPLLKEAGANRFVAGSAIFGTPDPVAAYHALAAL